MDTIVKGIVLKSKDYKENDKLLTILTLERGKILVGARGAKKQSSKLKAFCQSFCFADFELATSQNKNYILTGANCIENFFSLTTDINKFNLAFCVLEILDKVCVENQTYPQIFVESLKCLKQMSFSSANVASCLIKFIIEILKFEGFNINVLKCSNCKTPLVSNLFLDLSKGEILCSICKNGDCIELERAVFSTIKILSDCDYEKLATVKISQNILDKTLKILIQNLNFKFDIKINSILL